ncbi:MAG: hypothetical protein E7674_08340 [Ruminococcaceae bacterium]|nr:hypothetical protein [Oscillospiraceae bacterium]
MLKAIEVLEKLNYYSGASLVRTVDTLKAGSDEKETSKVAFCFTATADVIKAAKEWGADVLVTHEPTYHDHFDNFRESEVACSKRQLLESTGMTVYRWHDHPHAALPDIIHAGFLEASALHGTLDGRFFILDKPMTSREIAREIEKNCGIKHARIIGACDTESQKIGMCLGACGDMVFDIIRDTDCEVVIAGEICEWREGCYTRDAAQLGFNKSIILLGHCASERDGMKYLADIWNTICPDIPGRYFETGELFNYTEDKQ